MSEETLNREMSEESDLALEQQEDASTQLAPTEADKEEPQGPLSATEFRSVLEKLNHIGITWTADIPPRIRLKDETSKAVLLSEEFLRIQEHYPQLPRELGIIIFYALTGSKNIARHIGSQEEILEKVAAIAHLVNDPDFRTEFFFKYAIKVPYFSGLDWEIVIKAKERNVEGMPGVAYALLSLVFERPARPFAADELAERQLLTVAVDTKLINKIIRLLEDAKTALQESQSLVRSVNELRATGENDDDTKNG